MSPTIDEPTSLLLQDFLVEPAKVEHILDRLTSDQIEMIESTINRVKRRKFVKQQQVSTATDPAAAVAVLADALAAALTATPLQPGSVKEASTTPSPPPPSSASSGGIPSHDLTAEVKDGVEWVSFVYSHNRTLKRYKIRTDIHTISLDAIDDKFKSENCVYPRANLPKETYRGNRWAYETECNVLGWKLAWLNAADISGKRGLIQRAVDSYRNRYPSMRSRRVARQEKLLNGTLRKRKNKEMEEETLADIASSLASCNAAFTASIFTTPTTSTTSPLNALIVKPANHPKTLAIDDLNTNTRHKIKINVETVNLDDITPEFRKANCPYSRVMGMEADHYIAGRTRWLEETMCNELAWKLAWLNPKILANKKNLLQRAVDMYRTKFIPSLHPRKNSTRSPPIAPPQPPQMPMIPTMPLTVSALSEQNARFARQEKNSTPGSPTLSCVSGTTASLDFGDCFSLADESSSVQAADEQEDKSLATTTTTTTITATTALTTPSSSSIPPLPSIPTATLNNDTLSPISASSFWQDTNAATHRLLSPGFDESSCHTASTSNSVACTPSPPASSLFFGMSDMDLYDSFMLPPVNDTFLTLNDQDLGLKYYDPLTSPSLPSSALQQQDVIKMEDFDDGFNAGQLLDPLF
ncbi:uncharacterized protein BYT42DRAFT_564112 [Radiomyces spectabilis]|uniref:uncharacterized protein n=1 Tax=Radiomyces spectabilis TaxID=64574 RepID=UPI002220C584|nr:uncharacterized protein BYT42DRAFT_564112 [Radiomyces spectabilis]KAI8384928.1 hypothetical protein BYT42DRAFT_564112 [Radiomyces spectabilis]